MKLKHLFLAALAVGTFASCSNDGDGLDAPVYKDIDANISLTATPKTTVTRASSVESGGTEKGSNGEQFIHTLTALVFDEMTGSFVAKFTSTSDGTTSLNKIENMMVKVKAEEVGDISTSSFKVVLVANVANIPDPASLEDFQSKHFEGISNYTFAGVNGASQTQYLPMGSSVVTVRNLVAGTAYDNWIKAGAADNIPVYVNDENKTLNISNGKVSGVTSDVYLPDANDENKIALTRYVARVQLESLNADFKENWSNAEFHLTNVALANVSNASRFVENESSFEYVLTQGAGGAYEDNAFYRGYPETINRADYYLALGQYNNVGLAKTYSGITISNNSSTTTFKDATTTGTPNASNEMAQFYAFEFDGYGIKKDNAVDIASEVNTLLIITGKISGVSGINPDEERSYRIPIKHDNDTKAVKRNYIYKVNATLTGTGTPNPDETLLNAFMSFTIKVEPWNVITQTEDDVN